MDDIEIALNLPGNRIRLVRISTSATVRELKLAGLHQLHQTEPRSRELPLSRAAVVFAGTVLSDDQILSACLIRDATVVHFIVREQPAVEEEDLPTEAPICGEKALELQCAFYGFCKKPCDGIVPLLLRFSCMTCGSSGFVVDSAHHDETWISIWSRKTVNGKCFGDCGGRHASANLAFKCARHRSGIPVTPLCYLPQVVLNQNSDLCLTCEENRSPCITFACEPTHLICLDCFKDYALILLRDHGFQWRRGVGLTMECPAGCSSGCISDPHHFYILGDALYEKFKEVGAEENFFMDGGYFCPDPGCNAAFVVDFVVDCDQATLTCPKGHKICRTCREADHEGTCDMMLTYRQETNDPSSSPAVLERFRSKQTIARTTKNCPGCRTSVERNGGCMHMTCPRCKTEFCWICVIKWNIDCMSRHWYA